MLKVNDIVETSYGLYRVAEFEDQLILTNNNVTMSIENVIIKRVYRPTKLRGLFTDLKMALIGCKEINRFDLTYEEHKDYYYYYVYVNNKMILSVLKRSDAGVVACVHRDFKNQSGLIVPKFLTYYLKDDVEIDMEDMKDNLVFYIENNAFLNISRINTEIELKLYNKWEHFTYELD